MISQKCDNKWAEMNLEVVKHTFPWVYRIKTFDLAWHTAKTYINNTRMHGQCMDTLTCLQMNPFVAKTLISNSPVVLPRKKQQLDWFLGVLRYFSSLVVELGGGRERERCPLLRSYLSCLPNDFWEMQSAYASLWPSVSFVYRLCQLNQAESRAHLWSLCGDRRCFSKTLGHVLWQWGPCCCSLGILRLEAFGWAWVCVCVSLGACLFLCWCGRLVAFRVISVWSVRVKSKLNASCCHECPQEEYWFCMRQCISQY